MSNIEYYPHKMKNRKKQLEKLIVDEIVSFLNRALPNSVIGKRIKLYLHKEWKDVHKEEYSLRPDIDILQNQGNGKIGGIEVKVFYSDENKYVFSGIDQALSLLRFGLDNTRLIHVFITKIINNPDNSKQEKEIEKMKKRFVEYASDVSDFIRNFKLPMGYTPFFCFLRKGRLVKVDVNGKKEKMHILEIKDSNKSLIIHPENIQLDWGDISKQSEYREQIRQYLEKGI